MTTPKMGPKIVADLETSNKYEGATQSHFKLATLEITSSQTHIICEVSVCIYVANLCTILMKSAKFSQNSHISGQNKYYGFNLYFCHIKKA